MATSRRFFLKQGTLAALAAGVSASLASNVIGREVLPSTRSRVLDKAAFQAQLNTKFGINHQGSKVVVRLVEVGDLGSRETANGKREAFSLVFRCDNQSTLGQGTYSIAHEKLGEFSFLIVPIMSRDKNARHYEAVINRLHG